jgi:hypothetical protein
VGGGGAGSGRDDDATMTRVGWDHLGEVFELVRAAHAGRGAGGRTAHVHAGDGPCAHSEGSVMQERRGMRIDGIQRGEMTRVE